jgi:hypothetical protein
MTVIHQLDIDRAVAEQAKRDFAAMRGPGGAPPNLRNGDRRP